MSQVNLIQNAHSDLITDGCYDYYGLRLATCGLDQRVKIWSLDEKTGKWNMEEDWKAHDAPITKISWAHPEYGLIIATSSMDRTVKVWERILINPEMQQLANGNGGTTSSTHRWVERATLVEAKGSVRAVEFAPHYFGLRLATVSTDNHLRIYEHIEAWQIQEEIDILSLATSPVTNHLRSVASSLATSTPTAVQSASSAAFPPLETGNSGAGSIASSLLAHQQHQQQIQNQSQFVNSRPGFGLREADGGWCLAWCKERWWGQVLAVSCGITGTVKIIQYTPPHRPTTILTLEPPTPSLPPPPPYMTKSSTSPEKPTSSKPISTPASSQNQHTRLPSTTTAIPPPRSAPLSLNPTSPTPPPSNTSSASTPAFPANAPGSANQDMDVEIADNDIVEEKDGEFTEHPPQQSQAQKPSKTQDSEPVIEPPSPRTYATTSISWAPSCGRSFHLIATGSRDGRVRIWKIRPSVPDDNSINSRSRHVFGSGAGEGGGSGGYGYGFALSSGGEAIDVSGADASVDVGGVNVSAKGEEGNWTGALVGEFDDHKLAVTATAWNVTGTTLSSAGNDGRIRLFKQTIGGVWRAAGVFSVEMNEFGASSDGGVGGGTAAASGQKINGVHNKDASRGGGDVEDVSMGEE